MQITHRTHQGQAAQVCPVKAEIACLLSDGRERTYDDICRYMFAETRVQRTAITSALRSMVAMNLVSSDREADVRHPIYAKVSE